MILKYGSYAHSDNEVQITISRRSKVEDNGLHRELCRDLDCPRRVACHRSCRARPRPSKTAYAVDGNDLVFCENDGTTETAHKLANATSLGGVKVTSGPNYPSGSGTEYSTFRTYAILPTSEHSHSNTTQNQSSCPSAKPTWLRRD